MEKQPEVIDITADLDGQTKLYAFPLNFMLPILVE